MEAMEERQRQEKSAAQLLAEKLDKELDDYMDQLAAKKEAERRENPEKAKPFDFDEWEKEISQHPAFMTHLPESGQLSDSALALQAMKYDQDDPPDERALQLKNDGNRQFKYKRYRDAVDCYTEGIGVGCADRDLNGVLYANRAAAHARLANFRSAAKDCIMALKFKPDHEKAAVRAVECFLKLQYPDEALQWIEKAEKLDLETESKDNLCSWRSEALKMQKLKQRDSRKEKLAADKDKLMKCQLLEAFRVRNIHFRDVSLPLADPESLDWSQVEVCLPNIPRCRVRLEAESLVWPVLLLYPESAQSDVIQEFSEDDLIQTQLAIVFSEPPPWDPRGNYRLDQLLVLFESWKHPETLCSVPLTFSLKQVLSNEHCVIVDGLPSFFILSKLSDFSKTYLERYQILTL